MASPTAPDAGATTPQTPSGGGRSKVLRFVGPIAVLLVLAGIVWYFNRDSAENANVGDCLHEVSANDLKIVKCDAADADVTVVGKVGGKTQSEAMTDGETVCKAFPDATSILWWGKAGQKGDVLCLKDLKAS
ncbi:hypothetical protein AB0H83_38475 [Dactylosporangium sp. NPDC050688]|uniref:LppU/SCO3897 family protein n=1 Tax=Dactylosporangium sp. NPDC050688 TaxID=3157217 RepID=UPI0033EBDFED